MKSRETRQRNDLACVRIVHDQKNGPAMLSKFSSSLLHTSGVISVYQCKKKFLLITEWFQQSNEGNFSV